MKIKFSVFLVFFMVLFSCKKNKQISHLSDRNIIFFQKGFLRVLKTAKDSTSYFIKQQNKLVSTKTADSLKQENLYQNGVYQYKILNNIDSAFYFFEKVIKLSKDSLTNKRELNYYYNLAKYYYAQNKIEDALYTLNRFKRILNKNRDLHALGYIYNLKAKIFEGIGAIDSVYAVNNKTISVFKNLKDERNAIISSISKANYLNYLHNNQKANKLLDSLYNLRIKDNYLEFLINKAFGDFNYDLKKYEKASYFYLKAYEKIGEKTDKDKKEYGILALNKYYASLLYNKDLNSFPNYIDSVQDVSVSLYVFKEFLKNKIHYSYLKRDNFDSIEKDLDSFYIFLLKDANKRKKAKFTALEKANKKEKELLVKKQKMELKNSELKQRQIILFGAISVLLLTFLVLLLWLQKRKLKHSRDVLLMQQRLFRSQMNPHFTSNVLSALQNLVKEDVDKTVLYINKFSRLLRIIFNNSTKDFVVLEDELEALVKYIQLQQFRFQDIFDFKLDIDKKIETDSVKIPPMLIQPFVENAIIHGFKSLKRKGVIKIELKLVDDNYLFCTITDNGKGIIETDSEKMSSTKLLKRLIYKLTAESVKIINKNNKGVIVSFKIPYIFEI